MDLNHFAKAISDYQRFIQEETKAYQSKVAEAQQRLIAALGHGQVAKEPQSASEEIYEDVIKMSRKDYEVLQTQLGIISQTHPEIPKV